MALSPIGVLHTVLGLVALVSVSILLWQQKRISSAVRLGQIYLLATLITAGSALTLFRHGSFNAAHGLAILTMLAVIGGFIIEKRLWFRSWNKYWVCIAYSSTVLFHLLPTATEILTRFPMDAPLVSSLKDPLLQKTFMVITLVFMVMLLLQLSWLRKQPQA